jgi:nudix-type nucleoside diphosphatase (YffH/AdpP family)
MPVSFKGITAIQTLFDGWNRFHRATAELVDETSGVITTVTHSVEEHGDGVGILPFDRKRGIVLMVRQMRMPAAFAGHDPMVLEAPAGGTDGDAPEVAARRELSEEVGIENCDLEYIGTGYPMPGISTELTHLFLARFDKSQITASGGGLAEEGEHIEVVEMAIHELIPAIKSGSLKCMRTIALTYALKDRHPELFAA